MGKRTMSGFRRITQRSSCGRYRQRHGVPRPDRYGAYYDNLTSPYNQLDNTYIARTSASEPGIFRRSQPVHTLLLLDKHRDLISRARNGRWISAAKKPRAGSEGRGYGERRNPFLMLPFPGPPANPKGPRRADQEEQKPSKIIFFLVNIFSRSSSPSGGSDGIVGLLHGSRIRAFRSGKRRFGRVPEGFQGRGSITATEVAPGRDVATISRDVFRRPRKPQRRSSGTPPQRWGPSA